MSDTIGENDLIFYSSGENIYSGGFSIDSILMREGASVMQTVKNQNGGSVDGIFGKNYVVPPMWFLSPYNESNLQFGGQKLENNYESEVIEEDLHDKLLNILEGPRKETKKKTAKLSEKKKRTTKRNIN
jgi:hypothetical protein